MVYLFLAPGFEEIEALTPVDVLRRAGLDVCTVAVSDNRTVPGSHNIPVTADLLFSDASLDASVDADFSDATMFILPGGMPGAKNLRACEPLCRLLTDAADRGLPVAAICAAPFILGELGILKGKSAICYPGFEDRLLGATVSDRKVVRDGNILTAAGMGVALEFALAAVEMLIDKATADRIAASVMR